MDFFEEDSFLPVTRSTDSVSMLRGLSSREPHTREDTVSQCRSMFGMWFYGLGSPPAQSDCAHFLEGSNSSGDPTLRWQIEEQLPELLRLSMVAPLPDVREKAGHLLSFVEDSLLMSLPRPSRAASSGASQFIPQSELIPTDGPPACASSSSLSPRSLDDADPDADAAASSAEPSSHDLDGELIQRGQSLLADQFHEWHRLCNVFHVMAFHPAYLDTFLQFHSSLLQGSGPVRVADRHYLAVMAASRHRNTYLAHLHSVEFVHLNGDQAWLRGLDHAAPKMRKLGQLCKLLTHRPWELTAETLRGLLTGQDSLSQSELVHALCILAHFVALAGFVAGTGVSPEIDSPLGHTYRTESGDQQTHHQLHQQQYYQHQLHQGLNGSNGGHAAPSSPAASSPGVDPKQRVLELVNAIKDLGDLPELGQQLPEDQLIQRFECIEQETADIRCFIRSLSRSEQQQQQQHQQQLLQSQQHQHQHQISYQEMASAELARLCEEPGFDYKDFHLAKADNRQLRSFRVQDYSWEGDASCLVDRFLPSLSVELDDRFQTSFNLTYGTMGTNRNVETAPFRRAVWYYVHSIFGLRHDDYDYNLINRMLSIDLKKYCKLVACWPEQVTKAHYKSAMPGFKHSEKVHVNLVIMDARLQAILLYGLRAINNHMTGQYSEGDLGDDEP